MINIPINGVVLFCCALWQDASQGVTDETWQRLVVGGIITDSYELFRLTFYGGVVHHLRKEVNSVLSFI